MLIRADRGLEPRILEDEVHADKATIGLLEQTNEVYVDFYNLVNTWVMTSKQAREIASALIAVADLADSACKDDSTGVD